MQNQIETGRFEKEFHQRTRKTLLSNQNFEEKNREIKVLKKKIVKSEVKSGEKARQITNVYIKNIVLIDPRGNKGTKYKLSQKTCLY